MKLRSGAPVLFRVSECSRRRCCVFIYAFPESEARSRTVNRLCLLNYTVTSSINVFQMLLLPQPYAMECLNLFDLPTCWTSYIRYKIKKVNYILITISKIVVW